MPYRINPFTGELDLVLGPGEGTSATQFDTDSGTALPTGAGVITMAGGTGINTSGAGSTVTFNLDDPVVVDNGGTGQTSLTDGAILVGDGSNPVELIGPLTDGQLLIGDTAGVSPVAATLTAGTGITVTNGAGTITLDVSGTTPLSFPTDSGTATPAANALNILGGTLLDTSGAGNTVTVNADDTVVASVPTDAGTATPAGNAFTIAGSGSVSTSASGSTVTIAVSGSGLSWNVETGTSASIAVNNGYIANNAAGVTFTLPATAAVGETMQVTGLQASWTIAQNGGQTIHFGTSSTTPGVGGSLASTDARDVVEFICVVANTDFQVISSIGNITVT
jgi:hypothetical protein